MLIIPEVQIAGGKLVTRTGVNTPYLQHAIAPLQLIEKLVEQGAERLHVVDVDAANGNERTNTALVHEILASTHVPIQVGGGMRTVTQIDEWLEVGAAAVVLGTLAIKDQSLLAEVCARHPGAIVANLATRDGVVMIDGWKTATAFRPQDIVYDLQMAGVAAIIHTDIDRFEGDSSTSLALTMELKNDIVIPVYASGTVQSLDDIARIRYLPNIYGVIVGHALASGAFSLSEALDVAGQAETSPQPDVETFVAEYGIQSVVHVYLAAFNRSLAARWWSDDLRNAIVEDNQFVEVNIPQEDLGVDVDDKTLSPRQVQALYETALDAADVVVVALDGVENEAWTAFECGYARATGKYLLGIALMPRPEGRSRVENMCDDVVLYADHGEKSATLAALAREINSRLLNEQADSDSSLPV